MSDAPVPAHPLSGRRVLITGATGFLGRHLARRLCGAGADVHAVNRRPDAPRPAPSGLTWHHGDLTDVDALGHLVRRVAPDVVFHLASRVEARQGSDLALPMLDGNTRAAVAVMTAAHALPGCRVVLAGSIEEPRGDEPPSSPYAAAKAAATGYARMFHAQWDLPVTVLRLAMVYGPDQPDTRKLVPYVSRCLVAGEPPALSSGARPIDWVYIDDVCDALVRAGCRPEAAGQVLDVGSGRATTIAEVVTELARCAGYDGPLGFGDLADRRHDGVHLADPGPAAEVLGWRARTPLADGLTATMTWYSGGRPAPAARRPAERAAG